MAALLTIDRSLPVPERVRVQRAEGPDALAALIGREYVRARVRCRGDRQWMRITQVALNNARLDRISSRTCCEVTLDPLGAWHVARIEAGRLTVATESRTQVYGPGQLYLLGPTQRLQVTLEDLHVDLAVIRPALLSEATAGAASVLPALPAPIPGHDATLGWTRAYHHIRKTVVGGQGTPPGPLVVDALERLLVAATVALWPQAKDGGAELRSERTGYPETLRRAIAFIEASPADDICVDDVAEAACVTVRAVQLAFRRHLDTTPMAYLRRVRLACAHAELQTGASEDTVGAIAKRWGFGNAGRFAAAYRAAYGHPPLATLRKLRPTG